MSPLTSRKGWVLSAFVALLALFNKADTVGHVSYLSLNTADSFTSYRILDVNVCLKQNRFDPHFLPGPPRPPSFSTNRQRPPLPLPFTVPSPEASLILAIGVPHDDNEASTVSLAIGPRKSVSLGGLPPRCIVDFSLLGIC
jgi:hypothetical protein